MRRVCEDTRIQERLHHHDLLAPALIEDHTLVHVSIMFRHSMTPKADHSHFSRSVCCSSACVLQVFWLSLLLLSKRFPCADLWLDSVT